MKTINYTIEFYSDWHCGSGLAAGADLDLLVVKDRDNLPFVPGKTMKGLVREAVELLCQVKSVDKTGEIKSGFGFFDNRDHKECGTMFFSDATLSGNEAKVIKENKLSQFLYRKIASTEIDKECKTVEHSLRKMETVVPCKMEGHILDVDDDMAELIIESFGLIKQMGSKRTRGLGRCKIKGGIE